MGKRPQTRRSAYDASDRKTLHSALCHLLHTEFPGVFGPTITRLFADKIEETLDRFHPPRTRFKMGQALWTAVAVDDPPARSKRIEDTRLVPIVLDLVTAQDIDEAVTKDCVCADPSATDRPFVQASLRARGGARIADVSLLTNLALTQSQGS